MGKIKKHKIYKRGIEHKNWKGGKPKCIDCGKKLASIYAKRCIFCAAKIRVMNPETLKKFSDVKKGKKPKNFFEMRKIGWIKRKGSHHSEETKKKMSEAHKGEKSYMWIQDRTQLVKRQERNDSAYYAWRLEVWKRDGFKCRINNQDCSGKIIAHHILGWSEFPELRYQVNNGITLCQAHHPLKRAKEKQMIPIFQEFVVSKV